MAVRNAKPVVPNDDKRWRIVETRMRRLGNRPDALIEALHSAQEAFGYIDDDALRFVSDSLAVPPSTVFGVATFYHYFTLKPPASTPASCAPGPPATSTARPRSWRRSGAASASSRRRRPPTARLSLLTARCLGACSLAPAAIVDGEVDGRVDARRVRGKRLEAL